MMDALTKIKVTTSGGLGPGPIWAKLGWGLETSGCSHHDIGRPHNRIIGILVFWFFGIYFHQDLDFI